jgi:hypothetical protein
VEATGVREMNTYAITFRDDSSTICIDADNFFVHLMKIDGVLGFSECFAAYNSDNVLWIVKQNKYTEEEVLEQIKQQEAAE